jgi:probable HAF family extracellular repeat protein
MIDLGTLGGHHSAATGINNRGEVIGNSLTADGASHAFLWRDGHMTDLGGPGSVSMATDINERGEVVGINERPDGMMQAFLWRSGQMTALDAGSSHATGINERGDIVGTSWAGEPFSTVIWRDGHTSRPLVGYGIDINDWGQIVTHQADLWDRGRITRIVAPAGSPLIDVRAINNRGMVTGSSQLGAFVWQGGRATLLPRATGHYVTFAEDINRHGQIIGSSGMEENLMRAVLWTR